MRDKRDSRKKRFIEALTLQGTVYHAAKAAGVSRQTAYRWRHEDSDFADQWDEAHENAVDAVENTIYQQAVGGNTLAAIFYLKAHRPIYRDRLNIDIEQLRGEIEERMAQLRSTGDLVAVALPTDRSDHSPYREVDLSESEAEGVGFNLRRADKMKVIVVAFVLLTLTEVAAFGQSRSRIVTSPSCPYLSDSVVLEISGLRIGDKEVSFDESFVANDDWLASIVFRIVNKGPKPIAAIVITVGLLEGVDEKLPDNASYDYGVQFVRVNEVKAKRGQSELVSLVGPGKEIEITAEGSRPYGLRYMDAILGGTTGANSWKEFVTKAGARFQRMEVMGADIWFTDRSEGDAEMLVRVKCDGKK